MSIKEQLKPLDWSHLHQAQSPFRHYSLGGDGKIKIVFYYESEQGELSPEFNSINDAKVWAFEHYVNEMKPYIKSDLKRGNNWISADDALPTEKGYYLVLQQIIGKHEYSVAEFTDKGHFFTNGQVTHWMTLPKLPKGIK